jgi:hypothetical protein
MHKDYVAYRVVYVYDPFFLLYIRDGLAVRLYDLNLLSIERVSKENEE